MNIEELKKAIENESVIFGSRRTLKFLKQGKISKVFLATDCSYEDEKKIKEFAAEKVPLTNTGKTAQELGVLCKKPFFISVISVLAEGVKISKKVKKAEKEKEGKEGKEGKKKKTKEKNAE